MKYIACPECEANFKSTDMLGAKSDVLPMHNFMGKRCPGSGQWIGQWDRGAKKNPPLMIYGNPKRMRARSFQRPVGQLAGEIGEVYAVIYRHTETGEMMVHGFGPDGEDIELKTLRDGVQVTRMNINAPTHTFMYAVEDRGRRTVRLSHVEGEPLWDNF